MDMLLAGRTTLVTGSSAGIGAVIASQLAAEGCRVLVHGRDGDKVTRQVEQIRRDGGRADGASGDLGNAAETESLLAEVVDRGPVDILVANAGPFSEHTFDEATDEDFLRAFDTNVLSVTRCVRALLPAMRARDCVTLTPGMQQMFQARADAADDPRPWDELEADIVAGYAANPTGRLGRPEDIAAAAVFLASPRTDYVNGTTLRVDGAITGTVNP